MNTLAPRFTRFARGVGDRIGLPLVALAAAGLLSLAPMFDRWSDAVNDVVRRLSAQPASFTDTLVIDIDDPSLHSLQDRLGTWPYRRDIHALVLGFLRDAGARTVVFDIVFGEARDGDALFEKTLVVRPDTVLGMSGVRQPLDQAILPPGAVQRLALGPAEPAGATAWAAMTWPTPVLLSGLTQRGGVGVVSTPLDADRHLRRIPLLHDSQGQRLPALPLAALLLEARAEVPPAVADGWMSFGTHRWPVDADGRATVLLPSNARQVPTLAFAPVVQAALGETPGDDIRAVVAGRTVFIGSTAFLGDDVPTPYGHLSGTALLANAYAGLARDDVAREAAWPLQAALLVVAVLPGLVGLRRSRALRVGDVAAGCMAFVMMGAVSGVALRVFKVQVSPLPALVTLGALIGCYAFARWHALARANRQLDEARRVAQAASAAKSEFLANVSHELRTPLNAVLGMAEVLLRTPLTGEQRRYVTIFQQSGESLTALIDDLLDLSKIEADRLQVDAHPLSLNRVADDAIALLAPRAAAKGIGLAATLHADVPDTVLGDARRLTQVLVNLLGNAVKFTHEGGVTLDMARGAGGAIRFEVRDTGIGIAPAQVDAIFDPFVQAEPGVSRRYGGTGLGLSITKRLIALMNGRIEVDSEPGVGSVFRFEIMLPVAATPVPAVPVAPVAPPDGGVAILLAEDNDVNITVVEAMLQHTPHTIHVAGNGEVALGMFRQRAYGLVLMDIQMPGMDGLTATREIRRFEAEAGVPRTAVVALTANAFVEDEEDSRAAGCDSHLVKPLARQRLLETIGAYGRPGPPRERGRAGE